MFLMDSINNVINAIVTVLEALIEVLSIFVPSF
jgi:hypothetical protein